MLLDNELIFADSQTVSSGATVLSGVIDTKKAGDAIGEELFVHAIAVAGSATSTTVGANLRTGNVISSGVISGAATVAQITQTRTATIVPGTELAKFRVPNDLNRYIDLVIAIPSDASNLHSLAVAAFVNADK